MYWAVCEVAVLFALATFVVAPSVVDELPGMTSLWWFEGGDLGVFWRPVPSLVFEASVRLFGERALPLHLLSIIVHALVGVTLFLLVRRFTHRPLVAFLAGLFFLSCEDHTMTVGWIATFTDVLWTAL